MRLTLSDGPGFEREVRNIARELWSGSSYAGPATIGGFERDGIFVTEENIHIVEATISRKADKAEHDLAKISSLIEKFRAQYPDKAVKGWFVTAQEPTGEQGTKILGYSGRVSHQTYHTFYAKLVDSKKYLRLRSKYPFGSARNVENDGFEISNDEYVPVELIDKDGTERISNSVFWRKFSTEPTRSILMGEFGVGKSMFLRDLFFRLGSNHENGSDTAFPVYLNLRDHIEQFDPMEALTRHARMIGMPDPAHLVRAWRAGYIYLLLDGFDELTPRVSTRDTKRVRDIRQSALELVRRLVDETPSRSSLILAGRSNFFDDEKDLQECLRTRIPTKSYYLSDFDERQIGYYLDKKGFAGQSLPAWLPRRPLLVGYLLSRQLLSDQGKSDAFDPDAAKGWSFLIDRICSREVDQVYIALHPNELRKIYGRISTQCRKKNNRLGPVTFDDCKQSFFDVTQVEPEGRTLTALLRLPGLVGNTGGDYKTDIISAGARWFVDNNFADALSGLDFSDAIRSPAPENVAHFKGAIHAPSELTIEIAVDGLGSDAPASGYIFGAMERISSSDPTNSILLDLLQAANDIGASLSRLVIASDQMGDRLRFDEDEADLNNFSLQSCYFEELSISVSDLNRIPAFHKCAIDTVRTHFPEDVLRSALSQNVIERVLPPYDTLREAAEASDNDAVQSLVFMLDKLFVQSRSGRRLNALKRGVNYSQLRYVDTIIDILKRYKFVHFKDRAFRGIAFPTKAATAEAISILRDPENSKHPLVNEVRQLQGS